MGLTTLLPLNVQTVDTATPLRQFAQDMRQNKQMAMQEQEAAQMGELRDLQIIGQRYQNLDAREKGRIMSVARMSAELRPYLESGDTDAAMTVLQRRKRDLTQAQAGGVDVDTKETDRMIEMVQNGDLDAARRVIDNQYKFSQALGLLPSDEDTRLAQIQTQRAQLGLETDRLALENARRAMSAPALPAGVNIPEGFVPNFENGQFVGVKPLAGYTGGGVKPEDRAKIEKDLRGEYTKLSGDFIKVRDAYGKVKSADATAAGDISLLINYMKILDPGSVVREGEFATAQNATGVPQRIRNAYNNALEGTRLSPIQRNDFLQQAENVYSSQLGSFEQTQDIFRGLAERNNVNPENVVLPFAPPEKEKEEEKQKRLKFNPQTGDFE